MKRISFLLFSALLTTEISTHTVDVNEVGNTLSYAASDQTVLTDSLYNTATAQLSQLSSPAQQALAAPIEAVVSKRVKSMLYNTVTWKAVSATLLGGMQSGLIGASLALLPQVYQDEPINPNIIAQEAMKGFVTGAIAGLGSHILEQMKLNLSPYASAAVQGATNLLLVPTGLTSLVSPLAEATKGLLVQAAKNTLKKEVDKAGGLSSFLLGAVPSYETAETQEAKALTKPPAVSTAVQTQYAPMIDKTARNSYAAYTSASLNMAKVFQPAAQAMAFGALVGFILDKVLNVSFFPKLGPEYYAILGAMQGLINYARQHNIQVNIPTVLTLNTFPSLLLTFAGKSASEAPFALTLPYATLIPIIGSSVVELSRLFGGWQAIYRKIASELSPLDDVLVQRSLENLDQWTKRA